MSSTIEQVLVFPAPRLEPYLPDFEQGKGIVTDPALIRLILGDVLGPSATRFMERPAAEVDPRFKQVIPYCVLWSEVANANRQYVFAYQRTKKGGESRLHDKWSLGVGGHINPCDDTSKPGVYGSIFPPLYDAAIRRELKEEVSLEFGPDLGVEAPVVALIYDPSNEVGQVHFGVVHLVKVPDADIVSSDPALAKGTWTSDMTRKHYDYDGKFEGWSSLVVGAVALPGS